MVSAARTCASFPQHGFILPADQLTIIQKCDGRRTLPTKIFHFVPWVRSSDPQKT